jgi:hypothetical protein
LIVTENIPTTEPGEIVIGSTLKWTRDLEDYPASEYALKYYFRGAGKGFDAAATPDTGDGDRHAVTVAASVTAEMSPGTYYWQAVADKDGEKFFVGEGETKAVAGLASLAVTTTVDNRSPAKRILDAIDAMLAGKATKDQMEYQIGGDGSLRMLRTFPPSEWVGLRIIYARIVMRERRNARVKRGGTLFSSVKVRFDGPR